MTHIFHQVKFRWTDNLTARFIQLRKESSKLFTGRKYSAQAGWEHILNNMKDEFPTIMADVHYRVLKKKWSNLLQQYKELKNPVHGDKNNADDISWPFYSAIDEMVMKNLHRGPPITRRTTVEEPEVDPHEFLCVSVTPTEEHTSPLPSPVEQKYSVPLSGPILRSPKKNSPPLPELVMVSRKRLRDPLALEDRAPSLNTVPEAATGKNRAESNPSIVVKDLSKLRRLENASRVSQQLQIIRGVVNHAKRPRQVLGREAKRARKALSAFPRSRSDSSTAESREDRLESKLSEFIEYTKQRDEENRQLLLRVVEAVEKIADKF